MVKRTSPRILTAAALAAAAAASGRNLSGALAFAPSPTNRVSSYSSRTSSFVSTTHPHNTPPPPSVRTIDTSLALIPNPLDKMKEEMEEKSNELANNEETAKRDVIRAVTATLGLASVGLFVSHSAWISNNSELAMVGIFVLGYVGIIFEEVFEFNKAAVALLMSTGLWVTYADFYGGSSGIASESVLVQLKDQLAEVSDICFFLLAASTIVEVVDAHQGFKVVTNLITTNSKKGLFWVIGFLTFFLSAILNNLTVTIVMVSLLRKLVPNDDDRRLFGAMVVVAANAGGVWTPIGDVTTTMLWINNNLSTLPTITELFLPSLVCLVGSLVFLVNQVEEDTEGLEGSALPPPTPLAVRGQVVFWAGIASLLCVPVFSEFTGLPPYLAMVSLAMWVESSIVCVVNDLHYIAAFFPPCSSLALVQCGH